MSTMSDTISCKPKNIKRHVVENDAILVAKKLEKALIALHVPIKRISGHFEFFLRHYGT